MNWHISVSYTHLTFAGVWQKSEVSTAALYGAKPGDAKYVDINRDGKIDKDDIGIIGNAQPKLSFGFNNTFTIFDFDLNIFWQGVSGNDIYNQNRIRRETYSLSLIHIWSGIVPGWRSVVAVMAVYCGAVCRSGCQCARLELFR